MKLGPAPLALTLLLGSGCRLSLDEEHLEDLNPPFSDVHELCVQAPPTGVSQGTGFSLALPTANTFFFGDTSVAAGSSFTLLPNTEALATDPSNPCALDYVYDSHGDLLAPIALSDDELGLDESRSDGRHTALWPVSGFVTGDASYVFYRKVALSNYFDVAELGTGVAKVRAGEPAERLPAERYADEPWLSWLAPNSDWGTGPLLGNDGLAYVYGCYQRSAFDAACRVARVDPAHVAEPDAYRYYDSGGNWSDRIEQAASVLTGATNLSGFYSAARKGYVFVYSELLGNRVYAVTAPEPFGPFSKPTLLTTGLPPQSFWIGRVDVHPGLGSADGKRFVFGYHTDNPAAPGLHLVEAVVR